MKPHHSKVRSLPFIAFFLQRMQSRRRLFHLVTTALITVIELLQLYEREKRGAQCDSPVWLPFIHSLNKSCLNGNLVQFHWMRGRGLLFRSMHWALGAMREEEEGERAQDEEVYPCILIASYKKLILLDIRETLFLICWLKVMGRERKWGRKGETSKCRSFLCTKSAPVWKLSS